MLSPVATILVDCDDVINNLCETWCDWLNQKYGTKVSYNEITEWNMANAFPGLTLEQIHSPLSTSEFWDRVEPRQDAQTAIKLLQSHGHEVYICTASYYDTLKAKYENFIRKQFWFIGWDRIIVAQNKSMIIGNVLIDDNPSNLENFKGKRILYTAPHNRSYLAFKNDMLRCDNWQDVMNTISSFNI